MSFWKVQPSAGGWIGLVLIVMAAGALRGWSLLVLRTPISLVTFGLSVLTLVTLGVLLLLFYWTYGYFSLFYILDRDALRIHWAGYDTVIPIDDIRALEHGQDLGRETRPRLSWPGYAVGAGRIDGIGPVTYFATARHDDLLVVRTNDSSFAISPHDPEGLRGALVLRQSLGPLHPVERSVVPSGLLALSVWNDHAAHSVWLAALVLNLALFGYLMWAYPGLPPVMPFHFDSLGQVDRLAPALTIFAIPAIGALGLLLNGVLGVLIHSGQKLATLLLWGGTVLIQLYLWLATLQVVVLRGVS